MPSNKLVMQMRKDSDDCTELEDMLVVYMEDTGGVETPKLTFALTDGKWEVVKCVGRKVGVYHTIFLSGMDSVRLRIQSVASVDETSSAAPVEKLDISMPDPTDIYSTTVAVKSRSDAKIKRFTVSKNAKVVGEHHNATVKYLTKDRSRCAVSMRATHPAGVMEDMETMISVFA